MIYIMKKYENMLQMLQICYKCNKNKQFTDIFKIVQKFNEEIHEIFPDFL